MKNKRLAILIILAFAISLFAVTPLWAQEANQQVEVLTGENLNDGATTTEAAYGDEEDTTTGEVYDEGTVNDDVYEDDSEDDSVLTPDSFLYVFKSFFEKLELFFTFDGAKRAELLMELANKRLVEADIEAEKGNLELVKKLIEEYEEALEKADEALAEGNEDTVSDGTYSDDDSVTDGTYSDDETVVDDTYNNDEDSVAGAVYQYKVKNIAALLIVLDKVPDHVKPIIQRNIDKALAKQAAHIAKMELKEELKKNKKQEKSKKQDKEEVEEVEEVEVTIPAEVVVTEDNNQLTDESTVETQVDDDEEDRDEKKIDKKEKHENNGNAKGFDKKEQKGGKKDK